MGQQSELRRSLLNELISLRFGEQHRHVTVVGPVGVGEMFIAHALSHIAVVSPSLHRLRQSETVKREAAGN